MCGICGYLGDPRTFTPGSIQPMTDALAHRGPDGRGVWCDPEAGLALGHRRLKVLDLSERAAQPMQTPEGDCVLTYNGEVYNFRALRKDLEREGRRFRSESDTEVVLEAYRHWGPTFVEKLNGDFAFAIWDARERTLRVWRDRNGVRPLHWAQVGGVFLFASEIKSLFAHPVVSREPDPSRFREYVGHLYVCGSDTLFAGIHELEPGCFLEVHEGRVREGRYHRYHYDPEVRTLPKEEREGRFLGILDDAISLRQVSDVPLGLYLSGGVDSSLLACRLGESGQSEVRSYSLGFEYGDYNEFSYAREAARRAGTQHTEFVVSEREFFEVVERVIVHYDEPVPHLVAVPQYYLAKAAKEHLTVAVSGTGGDEILAGYSHYAAALSLAEGRLDLSGVDPSQAAYQRSLSPDRIASEFKSCTQQWLVDRICPGPDYRDSVAQHFREGGYPDFLSNMLYMDLRTHAVHMLNKDDKMNMAHGVEGRVPYLDHRLVQFALSLPPQDRQNGAVGKVLLKELAARYFPAEFIHRPKQAFPTPVELWFARNPDLLRFPTLRRHFSDYFDFSVIDTLAASHSEKHRVHTRRLWGLYCLDLWLRVCCHYT